MASPTRTSTPWPTATPTLSLAEQLAQTMMLPRDLPALVSSLHGGTPVPTLASASSERPVVGSTRRFWVTAMDSGTLVAITATLRVSSEHLDIWVEDQAQVEQADLIRSAEVFEQTILPRALESMGLDSSTNELPARVALLNALFDGAAGYFSSLDQYSRAVSPYSNELPLLTLNLQALHPGSDAYDAVVAHELQHLLHWYLDSDEDSWVNEGASELAEDLSGYGDHDTAVQAFQAQPDLQLTTWSDDETVWGHYGAAYLFMRYFYDRFGASAYRHLLAQPADGVAGFERVLAQEVSGLTFTDLFADWVVANLVDDPTWDQGRYAYEDADLSVDRARVLEYPYTISTTVQQYGSDYYELWPENQGPLQISFEADPSVRLVPNIAASGQYEWWSNRGDSGISTLEQPFDLRAVTTTAELDFDLWYDIERGWDYAYVLASTDGGLSWQLLRGAHMVDDNPTGSALGPGYTGRSGRSASEGGDSLWVHESIDLSAYRGQQVLLRFVYVTDDAVNRPGLCLDNFELHAIGYTDDVESGEGNWRTLGFVRHANQLPQSYLVQLVEFGPEPRVTRLEVNEDGQGEWQTRGFGAQVRRAVLIVSALAPSTSEAASYQLMFQQLAQSPD